MGIPDPDKRQPRKKKPPKDVVFGPTSGFGSSQSGAPTTDTRHNNPATPQGAPGPHVKHAPAPPPAPGHSAPAPTPAPAPDPQVIARQRTLRAAGYPVAVDGVWGPASQAAWSSYVNALHHNHSSTSGPVSAGGRQAVHDARQAAQDARQAARQALIRQQTARARAMAQRAQQQARVAAARAKKEAQLQARMRAVRANVAKLHSLEPNSPELQKRLDAAKQHAAHRPDVAALQTRALDRAATAHVLHQAVAFADQARAKPVAELTPKELIATTIDPLTGGLIDSKTGQVNPDNSAEIKRVQLWARTHGHPHLAVDGQWSKETNAALLDAYTTYQQDERRKRVKSLTKRFYDTGVVVPGQPLGPFAKAPAPGELLTVLQKGGFEADVLWRQMVKRYIRSQTSFLAFRTGQLDQIEKQINPFFGSGPLDQLGVKQGALARIHRLQLDAQSAAERGEMSVEQARSFIQEIGVLGAARDSHDLKVRLTKLKLKLDEQHRLAIQQQLGEKDHVSGLWGHTVHAFGMLGAPAHFLVTSVEKMVADARYVKDHPETIFEIQRSKKENVVIDQAVAQFQAAHPWVQFGLEATFDPLWLVDPIKVIGTVGQVGAIGAWRLEKLGLAAREAGGLVAVTAPILSKPADTFRAFQLAGQQVGHFTRGENTVGRLMQMDHVFSATKKLTSQKQAAVARVAHRVKLARRNAFRDFGTDLWGGSPVEGQIRFELDKNAPQVQDAIRRLAPTIVKQLSDNNLSLFVDLERNQPSLLHGQLEGFLTRHAQVTISQNVAVDQARATFLKQMFGRDDLAAILADEQISLESFVHLSVNGLADAPDFLTEAYQRVLARTGPLPRVASVKASLEAARETFKDILARIDFRGFGGHDVELAELIRPRLEHAQQDIRDVLSEMQSHLEARAEARAAADPEFAGLWDKENKWVGRGSAISDNFLESAAEGFAHTTSIPNRAFGVAHTFDEMVALRQLELNAATASARGTIARKEAEGIFQEAGLDERIANEKNAELESAWQQRDGAYYDTRESVTVPGHYATHIRAAFHTSPSAIKRYLPSSLKDILAVSRGPSMISPFVKELSDLAYALTRPRYLQDFDRLAASSALDEFSLRRVDAEVVPHMNDLDDALSTRTALLDQAERIITPRELVREYALWAALAKANSAPLRFTYKALSAFLDTWLIATLPLRPGFVVRNVIDNTAKMLADGAIDPRFYFPNAAHGLASVFELGIQEMRYALSLGGRFQNNPALYYFDRLIDSFWNHDGIVLQRIFDAHGIPVPQAALDTMRFGASEALDPAVFQPLRKLRNKLMYVMANMPENAAKRVLYRDTYIKAIREGATEMEAFNRAIDRIDFVLFDYSKVTVLEDNLRFLFPFVQFWRKTATFWTVTALHTPGLPANVERFEQTLQEEQNADLPTWMRRYVNITPVTSTLARIPGLDWLLPGLHDGLQVDPLNFFSFNVLYRTFKNENPELPPDKAGLRFIAPFVDALNDWGLSMNPLVRKPAEFAGVFNYRAWQSVFPETSVFDAISRRFFTDDPAGFNVEAWLDDKVLGLIGYDLGARQRIENSFNQWVQLEMAAQAERGEPVSREAAAKKIQDYYVVQSILGFFAGMYARRRDVGDVHLYNLAEGMHFGHTDYRNLSKKDQRAYQLFKRRKMDAAEFDRWVETQPQLDAFYNLNGTHEQREAFKAAHPEIIPYVNGWRSANVGGKSFVKTLPLIADSETAFQLFHAATELDVPFETRQAAEKLFVTQELRDFWAKNDTPAQIQSKMLQGAIHRHINELQSAYFSIPEHDYEAKNGFLAANPILGHYWTLNDSNSDDLKSVMTSMNASLRDRYFEFLDHKDYDGARDFLHRFPFIFEFTTAANRVTATGDWIFDHTHPMSAHAKDFLAAKQYLDHFFSLLDSGQRDAAFAYLRATPQLRDYFRKYGKHHGRGPHVLSAHARDFLAAKKYLDHFFALMDAGRKTEAFAYLRQTKQLRDYFARWGSHKHGRHTLSQHARDYLAIKTTLQWWFRLLKSNPNRANAWLDSDNPDAKKLRVFFDKYGAAGGSTEHARAYLKVKTQLKHYFDLRRNHHEAEARAYLDKHPELSAYFQRYSKNQQLARNWGGELRSINPDLDRRLNFWKTYWSLEPDARPAFVADHADDAGVFVYGSLSARQREDATRDYLRQAMLHKGMTQKAALYIRVKPFLDLYYTLTSAADKDLFLRANPELQTYLDSYAGSPKTGDARLDTLIESYFKLDRHSQERTDFIRLHPKLQEWFDKHSSPADVAVRDLLDTYFKMPPGGERKRFSAQHPEIQAYFDQRKREHDNAIASAMAFDLVDPRIHDELQLAINQSGHSAETMLRLLRESVARNRFGDTQLRRIDRSPTET